MIRPLKVVLSFALSLLSMVFSIIPPGLAQTLRFEKPLPESVAKSLHDMVMRDNMRASVLERLPHDGTTTVMLFFAAVVVSGIDPIAIFIAALAGFFASNRKSGLWLGFLAGGITASIGAFLDYSAHHYDGVVMSRAISPDFATHIVGSLVAVWIEAMIFRELIALVRRSGRKDTAGKSPPSPLPGEIPSP